MALSPVLSKERPDHPSLDYELLRSEGILHLENLATEVWTDFNAHDPGITLVELLSYAITDLGYRTRKLPIADIVAGGKEKSFFEPIEILPCAPVTARDFRKILIDIDGVKNAWVEPHRSPLLFTDKGIDYGLFEIDKLSLVKDIQEKLEVFLTSYNEDKVEKVTLIQAKKWIQGWKEGEISCTQNGIDPSTFFDPCSNPLTNVNIAQPPSKETDACSFLFALLCQYGYIPLGVLNLRLKGPLNPMVINGLLKVTLELDDAINPENESETRPILEQVSKRLQANRFLGHDYVKPLTLVGKLPIAICLHLEVASGKNALETAAAALWQIEQHLNPTLRFQTFQEMLDKGYRMDEIYNGPLLNHGFLDNHEVDAAQLLTQFRHSDLSNAATVSPDVLTVHELKVKVYPKSSFEVNTIYPIFDPQSTSDPAEEKDPTKLSRPLKPVIDLCKSCVYVTQDGVRCELQEEALAEALELKRLLTECHHPPGGPTIPTGAFRPDLAEYRSLQYDLPAVYGVGDYGVSTNISLAKQGVRKQLQAYLAFLINYSPHTCSS